MPTRAMESLRPSPDNQPPLALRPKLPAKESPNGTSAAAWTTHDIVPLSGPKQDVLCLYAKGEPYKLKQGHHIPRSATRNEALVQVLAIGLNPVDWKGADFGFGQPSYPWINGRDFAGVVVRAPDNPASRLRRGDVVFGSSTDYRDVRKAAFQEYLITNDFNVSRIPEGVGATINEVAALGTAAVAAFAGLGICLGINWSKLINEDLPPGPDLLAAARKDPSKIPEDVRAEVVDGMPSNEIPVPGEWIVVWGGGGVTGQFFCQLAKLAGLRVAVVDDLTQVGRQLAGLGLDFLIDFKAYEPDRIVEILRAVTDGKLRFGVDTVGKKTAEQLQKAVQPSENGLRAHIIGLSGLPEDEIPTIVKHAPPLKVLHELPECGEGLSIWLEELLLAKCISLPELEIAKGGLGGINDALDRLRKGEVMGKRLVVPIQRPKQVNGEEAQTNGA